MFDPMFWFAQQIAQLSEQDGVLRLKIAFPMLDDAERKAVFYWAKCQGKVDDNYFKQLGMTQMQAEDLWKSIKGKLNLK